MVIYPNIEQFFSAWQIYFRRIFYIFYFKIFVLTILTSFLEFCSSIVRLCVSEHWIRNWHSAMICWRQVVSKCSTNFDYIIEWFGKEWSVDWVWCFTRRRRTALSLKIGGQTEELDRVSGVVGSSPTVGVPVDSYLIW